MLNIEHNFYKYQEKNNPNYLVKRYLTYIIYILFIIVYFSIVIGISYFNFVSFKNHNYIYSIHLALFFSFFIHIYIKVNTVYFDYIYGEILIAKSVFFHPVFKKSILLLLLLIYIYNIFAYYYLSSFWRTLGLMMIVYSNIIFNTLSIISYSIYLRINSDPIKSFIANSFYFFISIIMIVFSFFLKKTIPLYLLFLYILIRVKIYKKNKYKEVCWRVYYILNNHLLLNSSIFKTHNEVNDFHKYLNTLTQEELSLYSLILKYCHFINHRLIILENIKKIESSLEFWKIVKKVEPNIIFYFLQNNISITKIMSLEQDLMLAFSYEDIEKLSIRLSNEVDKIKSEKEYEKVTYKFINNLFSKADKEIVERVLLFGEYNIFKENNKNNGIILTKNIEMILNEIIKNYHNKLSNKEISLWIDVLNFSEKILFFNNYLVSSIKENEWSYIHNIKFKRSNEVEIIENKQFMLKNIKINNTKNEIKKSLLKF